MFRLLPILLALFALGFGKTAQAQVVINEIHYHPVELEAFNSAGAPLLDLTDDVHEFIEIYNAGASIVDISGWKLTDGVSFTFPASTTIAAGGYKVVARNVSRLQTVYGVGSVLGPFLGKLGNSGDTVRLKDSLGTIIDAVNYSASFPWAQSADGLGANSDFLGMSFAPYQYKGRSLQRVSVGGSSNDAANWLAAPLAAGPTPGSANAVTRAVPKPVVVAYHVYQDADDSPVIGAGDAVRVKATFSSVVALSSVQLEWFIDDINVLSPASETRSIIVMTDLGGGQFVSSTAIPGQVARSIIRYRIKANRGDGVEIVSPRADDPQLVPVSAGVREGWHAYFVQPVRTANGRVDYDFFVSTADIAVLDNNISQSPRRVVAPDPPGYPRDDPFYGYYNPLTPGVFPQYSPTNYPAVGAAHWNGVVPGIFVKDGVVYDIETRYHGSRYQRSAGKNSWKFTFPNSKLLDGTKQRILVTEKGSENVLGYALFHAAGMPAAYSQFVDFYKNTDATGTQRCEITDNDEEMIKRFQDEEKARNPQTPPTFTGDGVIYKSKGLDGDEGPYGWANGQKMPVRSVWSQLDRYIWSYPIQNSDWRGHTPFRDMLNALWTARGDEAQVAYNQTYAGLPHGSQVSVSANGDALRAYLDANWDKDKILTYMAIRNWMSPWDDKFHNYHVYLQGDGKWTMIPWDFDGEMNGGATGDAGYDNSIMAGQKDDLNGTYSNNSRGPNWFKDSVLRAYGDTTGPNTNNDYRQKLFILNNTLLKPANVTAFASSIGISVPNATWLTNRFNSVNTQLGLGTWYAPAKPTHTAPANNASVLPGASLTASAYSHTDPVPPVHTKTRWEIRAASGTYAVPLYNAVSTVNLTSLLIPFELLTFGAAYSWRVTYYDAQGHPSDPSDETTFTFGPAAVSQTFITFGEAWKYNQLEAFSNNAWAQTAYNDATANWTTGNGALAYEPGGIAPPAVINTTLANPQSAAGRITTYFRKHFTVSGNPASLTNLRIRHLVDDGCVIYINGQRVHHYYMPDQASYDYSLLSSGGPGDARYQYADAVTGTANWGYIDPRPYLVSGDNVIAVEVHQVSWNAVTFSSRSSDVVFGLEMTGTIPAISGDIVFNEILADNRAAVANGGANPDYVELYNATGASVNLAGWNLTDDVLVPAKYTFPSGTTIAAGGYLTVWCDSDFAAPGLHAGFKISAAGQTLAIIEGSTVKDFLTFGPQAADLPIGRVGAGVGAWTLIAPSPNASNVGKTLGSAATLKINEWMANPISGEDWFELHNPDANPVALAGLYLSDTPGTPTITQIPALSFVAGKGFTRFQADGINSGANHCNFKLGASGDSLLLSAADTIHSVSFGAQSSNVSSGSLPDGSAAIVAFPQTPSPAESNYLPAAVVINEALTNSTAPFEDAIELLNPTGASVNVGGWWLSDDKSNLQKFQIPGGTSLTAGGIAVLYENQFNAGLNAFSLSSMGDEIILSAVDGGGALNGYRAQVKCGAAADNVSFGRVLTGSPAGSTAPEFWPLTAHTFGHDTPLNVADFRGGTGAANAAPKTAPVILNEVMYHPVDLSGPVDNARDEFIELHNITTSPQSIAGWKLKGDSDYAFAAGTTIQPGDYVLVVTFNPATDTALLDAFRAQYGLTAATAIYGPYTPKLSNGTQNVELAYPGPSVLSVVPFILVDKVVYFDSVPWPIPPDGTGSSLQRISRTVIGNDVANWSGAGPTPGAVNTGQAAIPDSDGDGIPDSWEIANGLNRFNAADAALDSDGDGRSNGLEYQAGTDPQDGASFLAATTTRPVGGGCVIHFLARAGRSYTIQWRADLVTGTWQTLINFAAPLSDTPVDHTDATGDARRFYRVITPATP